MVFTIEEMRPVRDGMTISRNSRRGGIMEAGDLLFYGKGHFYKSGKL